MTGLFLILAVVVGAIVWVDGIAATAIDACFADLDPDAE